MSTLYDIYDTVCRLERLEREHEYQRDPTEGGGFGWPHGWPWWAAGTGPGRGRGALRNPTRGIQGAPEREYSGRYQIDGPDYTAYGPLLTATVT